MLVLLNMCKSMKKTQSKSYSCEKELSVLYDEGKKNNEHVGHVEKLEN